MDITRESLKKRMRELIIGDADFRQYMDLRWGIDLLGRKGSRKATDAAMDSYYFFNPATPHTKGYNFIHKDHQSVNY